MSDSKQQEVKRQKNIELINESRKKVDMEPLQLLGKISGLVSGEKEKSDDYFKPNKKLESMKFDDAQALLKTLLADKKALAEGSRSETDIFGDLALQMAQSNKDSAQVSLTSQDAAPDANTEEKKETKKEEKKPTKKTEKKETKKTEKKTEVKKEAK